MLKKIAHRLRKFLNHPVLRALSDYTHPDAASQLALSMAYRQMVATKVPLPAFKDVGFKAYSQTDEDGILLFIFSIIGTTNKKCVEICAGTGIECNTANLIINHGWSGLLVDGNADLVREGNRIYRTNLATYADPPVFVCSWIKRDTVNALIEENGFRGEIDLLSLDLDGVDYWIWEAIEVVKPRVVVLEYQDIIGPEKCLTVPYSDNFNASDYPILGGLPCFMGASLPAFVKLARRKGYRLAGCNRSGYNAFFIRNDLGTNHLPEIPVADCFHHPKVLADMAKWPSAKDLPWVEV